MIYFIILLFLFFHLSARGNTMITTLYAIQLQANPVQLGFIIASAALFPMILAIYAGKVSDRLGYRIPLVFGSLGVGLALLLPYLFTDKLFILYLSQLLFGLAYIFVLVPLQNLVGSLSSLETRSRNFSTNSLSISLASLLGPAITGFSIDHLNYATTYLGLSIMAAVPGILIVWHGFPFPGTAIKEEDSKERLMDLITSPALRKMYMMSGVLLTGIGMYEFYFPIFAEHIGFSASTIGILLSINASAYFIVRLFLPWLIRKFHEEAILTGCLFLSAVPFFLIPWFHDFISLALISFILGLALGCGQPLSIVLAYNYSPKGRTGEVLGIRLTVNKVVQLLVPILFGSIGSLLGFFPIFWSNAVLFLISGLKGLEKGGKNQKDIVS
ncbi:MFS transporter [Ammoniphilus sp. 3BR4]|uniref:MFS transporter n=1 Tax=Ammoniphilus sp. 3BR4 TaxID=3158265 RepID=UPI003466BD28